MNMRGLKKIPAGLMVIPMFGGILLWTFSPQFFQLGSFTTEAFSNDASATIMGLQLFCLGSQIQLRDLKAVARRGGALLAAKFVLGILVVLFGSMMFGKDGIFGISLLAMVCVITNVNGSIYLSLVSQYGDEQDGATVPIVSLTNGPLLALVLLGISGVGQVSVFSFAGMVLPIAVGMILGNKSKEIKGFLEPGVKLLVPFVGFTLGAGIDLSVILQAGFQGILLSIFTIMAGCLVTLFFDKWFAKRPGYAGLASCATGANAVAVPAAVATIDYSFQSYVPEATAQIAAVVVICSIMIPVIVDFYEKWRRS